jgi:hypothetical protein
MSQEPTLNEDNAAPTNQVLTSAMLLVITVGDSCDHQCNSIHNKRGKETITSGS